MSGLFGGSKSKQKASQSGQQANVGIQHSQNQSQNQSQQNQVGLNQTQSQQGSQNVGINQSSYRPVDVTPEAYAGLRPEFANAFSSALGGGPSYGGPTTAGIGGQEQSFLDRIGR